jgi:triphosphatase
VTWPTHCGAALGFRVIGKFLSVGRARIEAALDEGSIEAQGRMIAVGELELELTQGEKPAFFDLAHTFSQRAPISLSFISKAERGYLLNKGV